VIGLYRFLFAIILPVLVLLFVVVFFFGQTKNFAQIVSETISCRHSELTRVPSISNVKIDSALGKIEEVCPKCTPAITDIRIGVSELSYAAQSAIHSRSIDCERFQANDG
jgi:hypothetical protein